MRQNGLRRLATTIAASALATGGALAITATAASGSVRLGPLPSPPPLVVDRTLVTGLTNPWDVGFLTDGTMFFTQRTGEISVRLTDGTVRLLLDVSDVVVAGEGGMLGLAVDPNFAMNRRIYTCFDSNVSGANDVRVARWQVTTGFDALQGRADILTGFPYSTGRHSGCRPRFGPDGFLYVGTGDAAQGTNPQSGSSLGGKVLRVDSNGDPAPGNAPPTGFNPRIYNYGHRNVQGIAFRPSDSLGVSVEHGTGVDDEANRIINGANFGWDPVPGYNESVPMTDKTKFPSAVDAIWSSGNPTIAPSGATFLSGARWQAWDGALAMAILKDQHLRVLFIDGAATLTGETIANLGASVPRLRSAVQGPDGNLYLTTDVGAGGGAIWKVTPGPAVPGPPTSVVATAGDRQASVSFGPPASDGGKPILDYTATCGTQSAPGTGSPLVVTGLTNGQTVNCVVTARNEIGTGPPSSPPVPVTPNAPKVVPGSVTVTESNSGTTIALVPVSLSAPSNQTVTADWTTANQQATAPADFVAASGTVTFTPGQTQQTVPVTIKGDLVDEADESLLLLFSNPQNATIGGFYGIGVVKIVDDDPLPKIVPKAASITEGNTGTKVLQVPVTLSAPSGRTVTASWSTTNDQAVAPSDFVAKSGTVSFAPGQTQKTVAITIKGDTLKEPNERFFVGFSNPTNATIGGIYGLGFATIVNDD